MSDDGCFLWSTTLGWYDFRTFTVLLARHEGPDTLVLTSAHEQLHHQLTSYTTYGRLMQQVAERAPTDAGGSRKLLGMLADESRTVQEMAATYCSLTGHDRQHDIIARMPDFYRRAFARAEALADRFFDTILLKRAFVFNVARCAMNTGFGANGGPWMVDASGRPAAAGTGVRIAELRFLDELFARGEPLPARVRPDRRLSRIEEHCRDLPADTIAAVLRDWRLPHLDCPDGRTLRRLLDGDEAQASSWASNVNRAMAEALCMNLEEALPGLEENFSMMRLHMGGSFAGAVDPVATTLAGLNDIRESAEQTVALLPGPLPRTDVFSGSRRRMNQVCRQSLAKTGSLRYFVQCESERSEPACFITDMDQRDGRSNLQCYRLDEKEGARLWPPPNPSVTIVESVDLPRLRRRELPSHIANALRHNCFVHVSTNPVRWLEHFALSGTAVKWTAFIVAYQNSVVTPEDGLQVVLYAVEGEDATYFHLSNVTLTHAIGRFAEHVIGDERKMTFRNPEDYDDRWTQDRITQLIDHPVFGSSYFFGRLARIP